MLATGISGNILDFAEIRARKAGITNVSTSVMDGEHLEVEDGSFDAVMGSDALAGRVGWLHVAAPLSTIASITQVSAPWWALAGVHTNLRDAGSSTAHQVALFAWTSLRQPGRSSPAHGSESADLTSG